MKISTPNTAQLSRAVTDLAGAKTATPTTTATTTATTKAEAAAPKPMHIEDAFGDMPGWKKAAVVAAGVAGLAVGGMIGEQIGMGLLTNMLPDLSMTAFYAIPLATTLGAALVGSVASVSPFFRGTELA